jgi:phosphoribosylanthranilate isomerase
MVKIKVCGMRDRLNTKEIAGVGPDFIGFVFYPGSPRYVSAETFNSFAGEIHSGIGKVGVFVNEDIDRVVQVAENFGLSVVQLHGFETPAYCKQLKSTGLSIIKAFNIDRHLDTESLKKYMDSCDYFLFDTKTDKPGGSGRKFRWDSLNGYVLDKPFFLSGGIGPDDAGKIKTIENRGFFAVDINSRFETAPGIKNVAMVKDFINKIKTDRV